MAGEDERSAVLDAAAAQLGLTIAPAWRAEILTHLAVIAEAAALVTAFALDEEALPAPIFRP
jgi:hypothetical protein